MPETFFPATTDRPSATQLQALTRGVDDASKLPASGTFTGQRIWLADVKGWAVWTGTSWMTDTALRTATMFTGWSPYGAGEDGCRYERRSGIVTVYVNAVRPAGDAHAAVHPVFQVDEGFRPAGRVRALGFSTAGAPRVFSMLSTGFITADLAQPAGQGSVFGTISYPAVPL